MLSAQDDFEIVGEASDGADAIEQTLLRRPDVLLMDIRMPKLDGIEATRQLSARRSPARVLIVTTFDLDEYVLEALRAGASGFVLKDTPPARLAEAVRLIAAGEALSPLASRADWSSTTSTSQSPTNKRRDDSPSSPNANSTR